MIRVENLHKSFGNKHVLRGLTFSVKRGEVYGLLGPNGAGKTTTINILCNLLHADEGKITIEGKTISESTRYLVGVVPQETAIYKDLTCTENLSFFASIYGVTGVQKTRRIRALLKMFNLDEYADTEVRRLSGGWQRRANIVVALVHSPVVLILDEPTLGLDLEARYELWKLIETLRDSGVTILLTTHQLDEAEKLCSRIGIMQEGRIAAEGSLRQLRELVPAKQLATIETTDKEAVIRRALSLGWAYRCYGGQLTLCLPQEFTLKSFVDRFEGLAISSVALHQVGLEHVYLEVTRHRDQTVPDPSDARSVPCPRGSGSGPGRGASSHLRTEPSARPGRRASGTSRR
ncbi:MAG: ABC transporter ATP-binding protein [Calditrichaeota bacterium]|nr:MAG: ABC transporter ATP-binding protein [Calditrichota bacterium]